MPWTDADRRPTLSGPLSMRQGLQRQQEAIPVSVGMQLLLLENVPQRDHAHREAWQGGQCT